MATHQEKRDKTFWLVLSSAVELDFKKGHMKWTMSDLSRKSGVTRSLIYYYFGRSKISILLEAVRVLGEEVVGIQPHRIQMMKDGDWVGSMEETRAVIANAPYLCSFYMNHRDRDGDIGVLLRQIENDYLKKLKTMFPTATESERAAIYAVFFGAAFAPHTSTGAQAEIARLVLAGFSKRLNADFSSQLKV